MQPTLILLLALGILSACQQSDDRSAKPTVRIEAPGARIIVDGEQGIVDIEADGARVYADKSGQVEVSAPGVEIETPSE
jgi:hypothetical protein